MRETVRNEKTSRMSSVERGLGWVVAVSAVLLGLLGTAPSVQARDPARVDALREGAPQPQQPGRFFRVTASTGFDFSSGDFDTNTSTDVWYVPISIKLELDPIFFKVTVPYVVVDGDAVLIDGQPEGIPVSAGTRNGIGDVVIAAGYGYFPDGGLLPAVQLSGKVKLGTADENKGLGTGEENYTIQLDLSKNIGPITPFAAVGYTFIGDPPDVNLDNKVFASAGLSLSLGSRVSVGLAYDWAENAVSGRPDIHEISPFASIKLGDHFAIDPYALIGLSSSSPDWGAGMQLRVFWQRE